MATIHVPTTTDWGTYNTDELDDDLKHRSEALAWSVLSALTGFQVGRGPVLVRPSSPRFAAGTYFVAPAGAMSGSFQPYVTNGQWFNACGCSGACGHDCVSEIVLPGPVGSIQSVTIDGSVIDPTAYRVDNGDHLVRQDGGTWPTCQNMSLPAGAVGTFTVTYTQGAEPNELLNFAAGLLAIEFVAAATSKGNCRLPSGVTQITRQGIAMNITSGLFENGMTGIREVDAVIRIYNPFGLKTAPVVLSVDKPRHRTRTWGH